MSFSLGKIFKTTAWEDLALLIAGYYFSILFFSAVGFATGIKSIASFSALWSLGAVAAVFFFLKRRHNREFRKSILLWLAALIVSHLLAFLFWENTHDGQTYHWQSFTAMQEGWNPWYAMLPDEIPNAIFINHYPKGQETFAHASIFFHSGKELGKAGGPLLALSLFSYSYPLIQTYLRRWLALLLSLLLIFNPVITMQLFTYIPDGQLYCCLVLLAAAFLYWRNGKKHGIAMAFFATAILISLKFTRLVYAGALFGLAGLLWLWLDRGFSKKVLSFAFLSMGILLFATFFISYNPYATNLLNEHHLFHPLMGEEAVNIMQGTNGPASFENKNRIVKLLQSLFSHSGNVHGAQVAPEPDLKLPLTFRLKEWPVFKAPSVLYGGFGPLFSAIVLICFVQSILLFRRSKAHGKSLVASIVLVLLTVLINPECWLARYVPHLWLVPLAVLFWTFRSGLPSPWLKRLNLVLLVLIACNAGLIAMVNTASNTILTAQMKNEYQWLKANVQHPIGLAQRDFISVASRLRQYDIPYYTIDGCQKRTGCTLNDSAGFKPITTQAILILPANFPPYQPGAFFQKLSGMVSNGKH